MLPSLAIDLDGCVVDFFGELLAIHNSSPDVVAGNLRRFTIDEMDYDFDLLGQGIVDAFRNIFNTPGFFLAVKPLPNAVNVLNKFRDMGFPSIICTAPARDHQNKINGRTAWEKYDWVQQYLPAWGNDVMITKDKFYASTKMLIDDYPPNITQWCAAHPDGVGYLVAQPWNVRFTHFPTNAVRGSLEQVIPFVEKFWCEDRNKFVYRLDELKAWR